MTGLRVGIVGTGAIARLHARAYRNVGYIIRVCTDIDEAIGRRFAEEHNTEFVAGCEDVCRHPEVDYVDVCTFPDFRLQPVQYCAQYGKHLQVQKPIAITLETARLMIQTARDAGILLGVVSQHRFDESSRFVASALQAGRLGRLLECDAYVKWYRTDDYYARPVKGTWAVEGGGALINQGIHQADLLRWLGGPVREVFGAWQLGRVHVIESEDVLAAVIRFTSGATGSIQASTAFWPGYPERVEIHGSQGTAILAGDKLVAWDVRDDEGPRPPLSQAVTSGASDPMAIGLDAFERQFLDFGTAIKTGRRPSVGGEEGYAALELVDAIYRSCRLGEKVAL